MLDYGIVGNCITCALINKRGSVDWMCFPNFSSPSIFAKILDVAKGGRFSFTPDKKCSVKQEYSGNTAILETTFECEDYAFKIIDFFPRYKKIVPRSTTKIIKENHLVRIVEPIRGNPKIRVNFDPRLDYASETTSIVKIDEKALMARCESQEIQLITNADTQKIIDRERIDLDNRMYFVVGRLDDPSDYTVKKCLSLLSWTRRYWQNWADGLITPELNSKLITRSAITLKLLTYSATGAIIAAATTSIPEEVGTERCYDYRYCWVRDASYTVDALKKIGRDYETKKFMEFMLKRVMKEGKLQIMYGIKGETDLVEIILEHLEGYKGSRPVRLGNAAFDQEQHDIYGELIDIIYLYFVYYGYEDKMPPRYWRLVKKLMEYVENEWDKKDQGIWEFRGTKEHFVYSKLMCWVGADRAIKIAQYLGKEKEAERWAPLRDAIKNEILEKGYNEDVKAFTMYYGSKDLDASLLHMTYHDFLDDNDPRLINTIRAVYDNLCDDYLTQRYKTKDDFGVSESAFTICSFWLVDALHYIGELKKARYIFDKLLRKANHLGLYAEDINIKTKKQIGNFPQAYTHIALINTSILLSEWSTKRKKIDWGTVKRKNWF